MTVKKVVVWTVAILLALYAAYVLIAVTMEPTPASAAPPGVNGPTSDGKKRCSVMGSTNSTTGKALGFIDTKKTLYWGSASMRWCWKNGHVVGWTSPAAFGDTTGWGDAWGFDYAGVSAVYGPKCGNRGCTYITAKVVHRYRQCVPAFPGCLRNRTFHLKIKFWANAWGANEAW